MKTCEKALGWGADLGSHRYCPDTAVGGVQYRVYATESQAAFFCGQHLAAEVQRERRADTLIKELKELKGTEVPEGASTRAYRRGRGFRNDPFQYGQSSAHDAPLGRGSGGAR